MFDKGSTQYKRITQSLAIGSFIIFCNLLYVSTYLAAHGSSTLSVWNPNRCSYLLQPHLGYPISLVPWAIASESFGLESTYHPI